MAHTVRHLSDTILLLLPLLVEAHVEGGAAGSGSFLAGLMHPVTGLDHVVAMVAVGLWGVQLGAPALWALPVAFPLSMALGVATGAAVTFIGLRWPGVALANRLVIVVAGLLVVLDRGLPRLAVLVRAP